MDIVKCLLIFLLLIGGVIFWGMGFIMWLEDITEKTEKWLKTKRRKCDYDCVQCNSLGYSKEKGNMWYCKRGNW